MDNALYNISERLSYFAQTRPDTIAIAEPLFNGKSARRDHFGKREYSVVTFAELDADSTHIAAVLQRYGVCKGMRIALMVRQGVDFISLVFALYKTGATMVLIDPGMGVKKMLVCLREAQLDGIIGIPEAHAARVLYKRWFKQAKFNVTVGKRYFWGGLTLCGIRKSVAPEYRDPHTRLNDPAAIIFTSGSTGVAKGTLYTYRMFKTQVEQISEVLKIEPGGIDLVGFPFFGLFNAGMGTTAVIPDMDPTRPGAVDPKLFLEAADDWGITQSFGSPALWNRIADYCLAQGRIIPTLKRVVIAGAPVSYELLGRLRQILSEDADIITPYGATESLPLACIESREVLLQTCGSTRLGHGVCVGRFFSPPLQYRIIPITDTPISCLSDVPSLPPGTIGELLVSGPQCSPAYVTRVEANALALVEGENGETWRRVGDVGYVDDQERFWFCGRKSHRVETAYGPLFSIPCEAIANDCPSVNRSALAGVSLPSDYQAPPVISDRAKAFRSKWREPVIVIEPTSKAYPTSAVEEEALCQKVLQLLHANPITERINRVLLCERLPVDVRHNAKINRELLSEWAEGQLHGKHVSLRNTANVGTSKR
ncbi:MAG: fatty acid CoA ligase family protein [Planctomycetia bacterium]|nr:fatty acid CoA ligase family protein [Planctomycetia bacterium]